RTKSKNAQEAHEAIRPTKAERSPRDLKNKKMSTQEKKLYELIFYRALATQMKEAEIKESIVKITSTKGYGFEATHQQVLFDGFLRHLSPAVEKNDATELKKMDNDTVTLEKLDGEEKETKPPYRYSEASLIKTLEE